MSTGSNGHGPWKWKEITLTWGEKILVRAVPPHLSGVALSATPMPKPPVVEIKSGIGNAIERREDPNDPEFLRAWEEANARQRKMLINFQFSWGVDAEIPSNDDWKKDLVKNLPFDIEWAEGEAGRKADYVKFVLLQFPSDHDAVMKALRGEEEPITPEEVKAVQDSFRD